MKPEFIKKASKIISTEIQAFVRNDLQNDQKNNAKSDVLQRIKKFEGDFKKLRRVYALLVKRAHRAYESDITGKHKVVFPTQFSMLQRSFADISVDTSDLIEEVSRDVKKGR